MSLLVDNNTVALVSLALDSAVLRQQAIAHNIANANTPGFRRQSVRFEEQFASLRTQLEQGRAVSRQDFAAVRPVMDIEPLAQGPGSVSLDSDVAQLSENTLQHQVLLKALNRQIALVSAAIAEGKR